MNSGLTWEQKFERWVASLRKVPRTGGGGSTIELPTPYGGRTVGPPTLECAEVAVFLRVTFASWHHLPFFLQGWDGQGRQVLFAGHFGFVNRNGQNVGRFPLFRGAYPDHETRWRPGTAWPREARLRGYHLGQDDAVPWLEGSSAGAGAYFDELFLNKRVGYFMRLVLLYFGSVNLADGANMYHVRPEAVSAGDVLLERWQRQGIGHTIPVVRVASPGMGQFMVEVVSGSMPRRQPVWDDPASARRYFTLDYTGGPGMNHEGVPYAALGGGLRRWRTAVLRGGQWSNDILPADQAAALDDTDLVSIAARPTRFRELLVMPSPEVRRATALAQIAAAREHLRRYPASCSARTRREDAFRELYDVLRSEYGMSRAQADREHRLLEDYVFAELDYPRSRTCCWNSTTAAMAEVILDHARVEQETARTRGRCAAPTVFRAHGPGDGYTLWAGHAMRTGRAADWRTWSEDEPCAQRGVTEDALAPSELTPWCQLPAR
jgi:hypothetical protein